MADTEPEAIYLMAEAVYLESITRANIIYKKTLAKDRDEARDEICEKAKAMAICDKAWAEAEKNKGK